MYNIINKHFIFFFMQPRCNINRSNGGMCQKIQRVRDEETYLVTYVNTNLCECPQGYDCIQEGRRDDLFYGYCQQING